MREMRFSVGGRDDREVAAEGGLDFFVEVVASSIQLNFSYVRWFDEGEGEKENGKGEGGHTHDND